MSNVNRAALFLSYVSLSCESLAKQVSDSGELTTEDMAAYDTIQDVVGEVAGMSPLDDLETIDEVVSELNKVGEVARGADPVTTTGEVVVGNLDEQEHDVDAVDSEVIIAAAVGALESLQTEVMSTGQPNDYHVNRYNSIAKVFFNGADVQPEVKEPSTLLVTVESWLTTIAKDHNITTESFSKLLSL